MTVVGLLLAAGSGKRFGMPKALVDTGDGPWVLRALRTLDGCDRRLVVLGAAAQDVAALLPSGVGSVVNPDHEQGMGSSLRVGLTALRQDPSVDAAVVMLVDLPDVPRTAVDRLLSTAGTARSVLARAAYQGNPGHPVLIGRDHFTGVLDAAGGDRGARDYLARSEVALVECGDLAGGADQDEPASVAARAPYADPAAAEPSTRGD